MYILGFCETLVEDNLGDIITGDNLNDMRIWSILILFICLALCLIGLGWVIKVCEKAKHGISRLFC